MNPKKIIEALAPHKLNYNPLKGKTSIVSVEYDEKKSELILKSNLFYDMITIVPVSDNVIYIPKMEKKVFLDMKFLESVLRNCEKSISLKIKKDDSYLKIEAENIDYFLINEVPVNSRSIPHSDVTMMFGMPIKDFTKITKRVAKFVSKDKHRETLQSICVRQFNDRIKFASTDGRTVCEIEYMEKQEQFELDKSSEKDYFEAIIPAKLINLIKPQDKGFVFFAQSNDMSIINMPSLSVSWKRSPDRFPEYERVFKETNSPEMKIEIGRKSVLRALKTAMIYGKKDGYFCGLKFNHQLDDNSIKITGYDSKSHDGNLFEYCELALFSIKHLEWLYPGKAIESEYSKSIFLSSKYLYNILNSIDGGIFSVFLSKGTQDNPMPIVVRPNEQIKKTNERYLLMPLRNAENRFA
jgi:DNA polymerase III sliding clamp (beta) subunit (PCNA family)